MATMQTFDKSQNPSPNVNPTSPGSMQLADQVTACRN